MQMISKFNKGICFLLCVIDIFSKYGWVIPLKDKKEVTTTNAFQKIAERFIRTLKYKFYKYTALISRHLYIDKFDDIVNKYNNTYHSTIKMEHINVK